MIQPRDDAGRAPRRMAASLGTALLVSATLAVSQLPGFLTAHYRLVINRTSSLPNWAFLVEAGTLPRRGEPVFFIPARSPLITRHFGPHRHMFGKYALGMPGDRVERRGADILIRAAGARNPRLVGTLKPVSRLGERLVPGPTGVIPRNCYYAGSPHRDGLDSRYAAIGFVCTDVIYGTARVTVL